jgi:hypothetical protein
VSLESFFGGLFAKAASLARSVQVESHTARFPDRGTNAQFLRITNRSIFRKIVILEAWFEFDGIRVPLLNDERPLPHTIPPEEVWETWFPFEPIPERHRGIAATCGYIRLSDGTIIRSKPTANVAEAGAVAGGGVR